MLADCGNFWTIQTLVSSQWCSNDVVPCLSRLAASKATSTASPSKGKDAAGETALKQYIIKLSKLLLAGKDFRNPGDSNSWKIVRSCAQSAAAWHLATCHASLHTAPRMFSVSLPKVDNQARKAIHFQCTRLSPMGAMLEASLRWLAGVYLMLWNPLKTAATSKAGSHNDNQLEFLEAAKKACFSISSSIDTTVMSHHGLMLSSCRQFTSRWLLNAAEQDEVRPCYLLHYLRQSCLVWSRFVPYGMVEDFRQKSVKASAHSFGTSNNRSSQIDHEWNLTYIGKPPGQCEPSYLEMTLLPPSQTCHLLRSTLALF